MVGNGRQDCNRNQENRTNNYYELERGMKNMSKITLGILAMVFVIVLGIGGLVILDVYSVEASTPGNNLAWGTDGSNRYPPPEPDLCPEPYPPPPPYQPPYPEPCQYEYLPLLFRQ